MGQGPGLGLGLGAVAVPLGMTQSVGMTVFGWRQERGLGQVTLGLGSAPAVEPVAVDLADFGR